MKKKILVTIINYKKKFWIIYDIILVDKTIKSNNDYIINFILFYIRKNIFNNIICFFIINKFFKPNILFANYLIFYNLMKLKNIFFFKTILK